MRNAIFQVLVCFLFSELLHAQNLSSPIAGGNIGSTAYSLNHIDAFSLNSNQAALAQIKNVAAGVYGEQRFLLNQLNNYTAVIALPTRSGNFGVNTGYFGFNEYNETKLGLAYARKLNTKVDIGVQFNYHGLRIAGYGNASAISFEAGIIGHFSPKLHSGIHINNPIGGKFGSNNTEKLPAVYTFGLGYDASEKFFFSTEIIKEEDQPVNVKAGFQYKFLPVIWIRAGISSAVSSVWIGAGISKGLMRLDITTGWHPQLGVSPGLLVLFNFRRKQRGEEE